MAFGLPNYNDRPIQKNPYVWVGGGLFAASAILHWLDSRPIPVDPSTPEPPAQSPAGAEAVGLGTTNFTPAQAAAFKAALPAAGQQFADYMVRAGAQEGVSPILLAGIMSNETAYGTAGACKKSPKCEGYSKRMGGDWGLMQINKDNHPAFFARKVNGQPAYLDHWSVIEYGAEVLRKSIAYIRARTSLTGSDLLFAGVAGYNTGPGNVVKSVRKGRSADYTTAKRRYGKTAFKEAKRIMEQMNGSSAGVVG